MFWASGGNVPGVPNNPLPARVINMSLGGKGECSLQRQALIDATLARGALVVVSAGNENDNADLYTPASCYGVSTVVATDAYGYRASYSQLQRLRRHLRARRRQGTLLRRQVRGHRSRRSSRASTRRPATTSSTGTTARAWPRRTWRAWLADAVGEPDAHAGADEGDHGRHVDVLRVRLGLPHRPRLRRRHRQRVLRGEGGDPDAVGAEGARRRVLPRRSRPLLHRGGVAARSAAARQRDDPRLGRAPDGRSTATRAPSRGSPPCAASTCRRIAATRTSTRPA